jgi:CBS domain-containing protein
MIETTIEAVDAPSPRTVDPETPVTEAAQYLRRTDVPAVPVLEDGDVVGIVTESDVVALVAETDDRPAVRAIMSSPVTTIPPTTTVPDAAERMRTAGVKHLPVVEGGRYRAMVSVRTLAPYLPRHRLEIEWCDEPMRLESAESRELAASD